MTRSSANQRMRTYIARQRAKGKRQATVWIPDALRIAMQKVALANRRSLSSEIIVAIEEHVRRSDQ